MPLRASALRRDNLVHRLTTRWAAKGLATTLGIGAFLGFYFLLLHYPVFTATMMPVTALDRWIGVAPASLPLYLSLWVYVSIGPALLKSDQELVSYATACLAMSLIGFSIFLFWPTAVPQEAVDWGQHPSMAFLKQLDLAANAFPSMHVAFAVFTAFWLERVAREMRVHWGWRVLSAAWCLGILYSTVATRQHVLIDVLGGVVLAAAVATVQMALLDRKPARASASL